jgi:hypothetical protein
VTSAALAAHLTAQLLTAWVSLLRRERDAAILSLADTAPPGPGVMLNRIRDLGMDETAFYQRLNTLLDTEAALAAYPTAVGRLRRLREGRSRRRLGVRGPWT